MVLAAVVVVVMMVAVVEVVVGGSVGVPVWVEVVIAGKTVARIALTTVASDPGWNYQETSQTISFPSLDCSTSSRRR